MPTLDAAYVEQMTLADPFSMEAAPEEQALAWEPRSRLILLPYVFVLLIVGASWLSGGVAALTDLGFALFAGVTTILLLVELIKFPRRFGVGGVILFAGTLIWFCYDYFDNWFLCDFSLVASFDARVVAKAAFHHVLLVTAMVAGLFIPWGRLLQRIIQGLPEPATPSFYFILPVLLFCIGISPYFIWAVDPPHQALWKAMTGGYASQPAFTAGRTGGNTNVNWGGYIAFIIEIGKIGGILAAFSAILLARNWAAKIFCWVLWGFWAALAFGSGIRGEILYMVLPAAGLLYLRYQSAAAVFIGRYGLRAYLLPVILLAVSLVAVQFVAVFRTRTYVNAELSEVSVLSLQGNNMFSESLLGFSRVGEIERPFSNTFPGASIVRPIPDTIVKFFITPIPRALWEGKPIDPAEEWYNKLVYGHHYQGSGNVAHGAAGYWYFRYGTIGLLQGGLLLGWLLAVTERSIRESGGRLMSLLLGLAVAVWLFRCFRGFSFVTLHPVLVGSVVLWFILRAQRLLRAPA